MPWKHIGWGVGVLACLACGNGDTAASEDGAPPAAATAAETVEDAPAAAAAALEVESAAEDATSQSLHELRLDTIWKGDLDGIVERGRLRVLVTYSRTGYFLEGGRPRGITYEFVEEFKRFLNKKLKLRRRPIATVYIPTARDELLSALAAGRGDIAAANLTITPERARDVTFSAPIGSDAREVIVTGPSAPEIATVEDLSGVEVSVRRSSSFRASLEALNERLRAKGATPVLIRDVDEVLETEDILDLVSNGLIGTTVADDHTARFWADVLPNLEIREDLVLRDGVDIAWALRQDTPELEAAVNEFVKDHRQGTLFGNVLIKRYLKSNPWVRQDRSKREFDRLSSMVEIFKKYGDQYDFDHLMVAAQGYQESGLDQSVVSHVGAVGVMQVLPSTAASHEVGIPDISDVENNIHAGTKYLHVLVNNYFNDPELDEVNRQLFAFAGYNAGPNRIQRLRKVAADRGLDPNKWFENVEVVVAEKVGSEPVKYVSNIYKYYVAYRLDRENEDRRQEILETLRQQGG